MDLGLLCLSMSHKKDVGLIWINRMAPCFLCGVLEGSFRAENKSGVVSRFWSGKSRMECSYDVCLCVCMWQNFFNLVIVMDQ